MSMKPVKDKMVRPSDMKDKRARSEAEAPAPAAAAQADDTLICVKECNVPGVGTWKAGETITDPATISKVKGSPYFQPVAKIQEGG